MKKQITSCIPTECPWRDTLYWYDTIDSTNTHLKTLAKDGAPEGTVVLAGHQTQGRGRLGRSFHSPQGGGVYLSLLLRPQCPPEQLMHLTCAAGIAACDAIDAVSGFRPGIKWINDLVADSRKLGGILTELSIDPQTGLVNYAIIGIGINCKQMDFPEELQSIVTSLDQHAKQSAESHQVAAAIITELWKLRNSTLLDAPAILTRYRKDCITLGAAVTVLGNGTTQRAVAVDLDPSGGLIVELEIGKRQTVSSGEVSVRGLYGYVE